LESRTSRRRGINNDQAIAERRGEIFENIGSVSAGIVPKDEATPYRSSL